MLGISSPAQKSHEQLIYIWRWTFLFGVIQFTTNHWETIADIFCRQHHCTLLVLLIWNYWLWLESKEPEVRRAFLTQASASVSCMCDTTRRPDAQTRRASFLAVTRASKELLRSLKGNEGNCKTDTSGSYPRASVVLTRNIWNAAAVRHSALACAVRRDTRKQIRCQALQRLQPLDFY